MKVLGIIAEYNPFHNGHLYHLRQAVALAGAQAVVAVISGAVTQRGEPAFADKWSRARMAVDNGVDLVLELPFAFACNSAEEFARGGVCLLKRLGCVTDMAFGCESEPDRLIEAARVSALRDEEFSQRLRRALNEGLAYPAARSRALLETGGLLSGAGASGLQEALRAPNDILAVEYVRQLQLQEASIRPWGIRRTGSGYHSLQTGTALASAAAIRRAISRLQAQGLPSTDAGSAAKPEAAALSEDILRAVPKATLAVLEELLQQGGLWRPQDSLRLDAMLLSQLRRLGPPGLRQLQGCSEGLEYRLWKALPYAESAEQLLSLSSCARYSTARMRRLLCAALMDFDGKTWGNIKESADKGLLYGRVLGIGNKGAQLLRCIRSQKRREEERSAAQRDSLSESVPLLLSNLNRELTKEQKRFVKGETAACADGGCAAFAALRLDVRAADLCRTARAADIYSGSDFVRSPYVADAPGMVEASGKNENSIKTTGFLRQSGI